MYVLHLQQRGSTAKLLDVVGLGFPDQLRWPEACDIPQALRSVSAFDQDSKGWLLSKGRLARVSGKIYVPGDCRKYLYVKRYAGWRRKLTLLLLNVRLPIKAFLPL